MDGVISELVRKRMSRYLERNRNVIYAHYFDYTVWAVLKDKLVEPNGFMIVGELLHAGLENMVPANAVCKEIQISTDVLENLHPDIRTRFILDGNFVKVCGNADGLYNGKPIELKTTRKKLKSIPQNWKRRSKVYAWLYNAPCILAIVNIITGEEIDIEVEPPTESEIKDIVEKWLLGKYPYITLH